MYRWDYAIERLHNQTRRNITMLKNTKAVGVASAIALLTGVAFAPSATAAVNNYPEVSVTDNSVDAGDAVEYYVDYVRTGCKVITTLGSVTRTEKATTVGSGLSGAVADKLIPAPSKAGEYTLRSRIANDCAADAGYSNKYNMSADITVGDEIVADSEGWEITGARAVRIYGDAENATVVQDLGTVKIQAYVKGEMVASTYTDSVATGAFSIVVESKYLNKKGNTQVTLKLSSNKFFWMDQKFVVNRSVG
jgi:hypothetical protein